MLKAIKQKRTSKHNILSKDKKKDKVEFNCNAISSNIKDISYKKILSVDGINKFPIKNEQYRIITQKRFNTFDFILSILSREEIFELYLVTFMIGSKTIENLHELLLSKQIHKSIIIVNNAVRKFKPTTFEKLLHLLNTKVIEKQIHAKIILAKTKDNFYVIEGSGNLSINAKIEQYVFENNKQVYEFHKKWIKEM